MTWFGRDLLVDRHRSFARGAHPLGCESAGLSIRHRHLLRAEPRLGAESVAAFVRVRGDGGESDYCDDAEYFVHDFFLFVSPTGWCGFTRYYAGRRKSPHGNVRMLDTSVLPLFGERPHEASDQFVVPPNNLISCSIC